MTSDTASIAALPPGTYRLDPQRSQVHYSGKHLFGLGTVHATLAVQDGELRIGDPMDTSSVSVTVDAASFTSGSARRDRDVRSAGLLDVETYPTIVFESADVQVTADGLRVTGTVTAHGHPVAVDVLVDRVAHEDTGIRIHGRAEHLDRTAFGITGSKGMVGRYLDLELDVFASEA